MSKHASDDRLLADQESDVRPLVRMSELATLPVFLKLSGKRAVIAGEGPAASWKAELLAVAGARVEIYASEASPALEALAASLGPGQVTFVRRQWVASDLSGAAIAIGAAATDDEAAAFSNAARAAGVPVNVIDRPEYCDFQFGAIVNRSPLIVAISTDGGAPVFAQSIRSAIEEVLPLGFKKWAEAAKSWRRLGDRLGASMSERRKFWERFTEYALVHADRVPAEADLEQMLTDHGRELKSHSASPVTIVSLDQEGADNLTLGAVKALRTADHIMCDTGVPAGILDFARREACRSGVKATASNADAIVGDVVTLAQADRRVVIVLVAEATDNLAAALRSAALPVIVVRTGSSG